MDNCDICHKPAWGFSLLGAMPWEKQLDPFVRVCLDCCDMPPCGAKGSWSDGRLTCPHGYIYTKSADWTVTGEQATLEWKVVSQTWWRKGLTLFGIKGHK